MNKNLLLSLLLVFISALAIYVTYWNASDLKTSNELNDNLSKQVQEMYDNERMRITKDSLKYVIAIDSLGKEINLINKKRSNELHRLKSEIAKINSFNIDSDFHTYNDSIKRCCANHTN